MVAVEALRKGDMMLMADGNDCLPVVWIGHREVDCLRHPAPNMVWPVRIAAGAFASGVPCQDLYLSPDHAVFAAGVLIPVKYLVNDTTIAQTRAERVSYFHVELPHHAVLLAEGLSVGCHRARGRRRSRQAATPGKAPVPGARRIASIPLERAHCAS